MDIIIAGEQGAGKSTAAALLLKALRKEDALEIVELADNPTQITGLMQFHRARTVLFDGCIATPSDMVKAVTAVKHYRTQINADVLAIYVAHGSAVMLSDGTGVKRNTFKPSVDTGAPFDEPIDYSFTRKPYESEKDFKERTTVMQATSNDGENWVDGKPTASGRTDKILASLWDYVSEKADEQGHGDMYHQLCFLTAHLPTGQEPGLHHLTREGKIEMHTFLLKLLRRYE